MAELSDPFVEAMETWGSYAGATENLVHLSHKGISWALQVPEFFRLLGRDTESIDRAKWEAEQARPEVEAGFPTLHAHTLLGLCGAFECFVEDVAVARLTQQPDLLETPAFSRLKLPVTVAVLNDPPVRNRRIVQEASRASNADLSSGVTRYERTLELVALDGPVPERVREAIFHATEIRNVWAHRGGIADERFVARCAKLGFALGERINMGPGDFMPLMHAFHMYGLVIANRYLDLRGAVRLDTHCPGFEGALAEIPAAS